MMFNEAFSIVQILNYVFIECYYQHFMRNISLTLNTIVNTKRPSKGVKFCLKCVNIGVYFTHILLYTESIKYRCVSDLLTADQFIVKIPTDYRDNDANFVVTGGTGVVILTTSGVAKDDKVGIMTTLVHSAR